MTLPRISVVIPAYNAEEWIGAAIASVFAQAYPSELVELIVVDDGSTDATVAITQTLLAARTGTHGVLHTSHGGPGVARNLGWQSAQNEWIQFLDADDLLEPDKLALQAEYTQAASPDIAALFSEWGRLLPQGNVWTQQIPWVTPKVGADALLDLLRSDNFIQVSSLLMRRAWLQKVGGYIPAYLLIEDVDLLMRMVIQGGTLQPVLAGHPLSWYRQRDASLSRQNQAEFVKGCVRNLRLAESHWRSENVLTPHRQAFLANAYFSSARALAAADSQAFESILQSLYAIEPQYTPSAPASLRWLSRLIGYRSAEQLALRYRRLKKMVNAA
jgi:glycosyltransferase involved in cell wall biosynthesis